MAGAMVPVAPGIPVHEAALALKRGNKSADKSVKGAKSPSRLETGRGYSWEAPEEMGAI